MAPKNASLEALLRLGEEWHEHANHVAGCDHLVHGRELHAQLCLGALGQPVALVVQHLAAERAQQPREFAPDLAHPQNADRAAPQPHDAPVTRPVVGEVVLVAAPRRKAEVVSFLNHDHQLARMLGEGQDLHEHVLGDVDAATAPGHNRPGCRRPGLPARSMSIGLRAEPLDQAQVLAGSDHLRVDHARPLGNQELHARQQAQDLFLRGRTAHGDGELGRRARSAQPAGDARRGG